MKQGTFVVVNKGSAKQIFDVLSSKSKPGNFSHGKYFVCIYLHFCLISSNYYYLFWSWKTKKHIFLHIGHALLNGRVKLLWSGWIHWAKKNHCFWLEFPNHFCLRHLTFFYFPTHDWLSIIRSIKEDDQTQATINLAWLWHHFHLALDWTGIKPTTLWSWAECSTTRPQLSLGVEDIWRHPRMAHYIWRSKNCKKNLGPLWGRFFHNFNKKKVLKWYFLLENVIFK
jgi:hypothetical protein